jgi:hypothetical protein
VKGELTKMKYAPNSFMGINFNSPTVQNTIQQNNGFMQPPYSMAPTFGNIGGVGYNVNPALQYNQFMNGGYYSGYYNNYNPQEIRRQIEEQRKAEEARIRNNINIQKMKARIFNNFNGIDTDEEYLEAYFNPNTYVEINKDLQDYEEMRRLAQIANDPNNQLNRMNYAAANEIARISADIRSKHPVDQSLIDYMSTAGDIY